ncbi:MAG: hypothetical protein ABI389_04595 [Rhodanobacter sp.]
MVRAFALLCCLVTSVASAMPTVFPSGTTVPENLLRIEVRLDRPLDAPLDMRHVALVDAAGKPIVDALLDLPLPSRDGREVTILLHPARIKTGVGANERLGMALHQGEVVTLVINDPQWGSPIRKSWRVTAAIRKPIAPASWKVTTPSSGTRDALQIAFPAALDSAATDLVAVAGPDGERLPGHAALSDGETRWSFVPDQAWTDGQYQIRLHPSLEDPAGNQVCSAFEQVDESSLDCRESTNITFRAKQASVLQ